MTYYDKSEIPTAQKSESSSNPPARKVCPGCGGLVFPAEKCSLCGAPLDREETDLSRSMRQSAYVQNQVSRKKNAHEQYQIQKKRLIKDGIGLLVYAVVHYCGILWSVLCWLFSTAMDSPTDHPFDFGWRMVHDFNSVLTVIEMLVTLTLIIMAIVCFVAAQNPRRSITMFYKGLPNTLISVYASYAGALFMFYLFGKGVLFASEGFVASVILCNTLLAAGISIIGIKERKNRKKQNKAKAAR